jgi:glycosyltransferase involved in cell wall biosynthesis
MSDTSKHPLVSIIIPVYNGARYVALAIESALTQDYPHVEVVVVNDGSTDEGRTRQVVERFLSRVRYFEKPNGGVASALNFGIREARGEYVSWLSHDDLYRPDKISRQMARMAELAGEAILYSDFQIIDENGEKGSVVTMPPSDPHNFRYALTLQNFLHGCTLLIPRACLEQVGTFDERLRTTQDYDLWFRLAERYPFLHVREPLVFSRHHTEQGTLRMRDTVVLECNQLLMRFLDRLNGDELRRGSGRSVMGGYVDLAQSLLARRFRPALWASVRKALRAATSESLATASAEVVRLMSVLMLDPLARFRGRVRSGIARRLSRRS